MKAAKTMAEVIAGIGDDLLHSSSDDGDSSSDDSLSGAASEDSD